MNIKRAICASNLVCPWCMEVIMKDEGHLFTTDKEGLYDWTVFRCLECSKRYKFFKHKDKYYIKRLNN